jgi:L-malate glycosyltransferase
MTRNVTIIYDSFGPYHHDRLEEVARRLANAGGRLVPAQISADDGVYDWEKVAASGYEVTTLFRGPFTRTTILGRFIKTLGFIIANDCRVVFHCGYQRIDALLLSLVVRMLGRRIYTLIESKLDDKPRYIWLEVVKYFFFLFYNGAIISGCRTAEYMALHGFRPSELYLGHNSVSLERVAMLAGGSAPDPEMPFHERGFVVVARLVPKKNYDFILDAYKAYRAIEGAPPRRLHIYGDGPEMGRIKKRIADEAIPDITFYGWVGAEPIAKGMRAGLCLLLLSSEEQWGNVVNEAIAVGLPVICTRNVGASDHLVRTLINGFVVADDDADGTARAMAAISVDQSLYEKFSAGDGNFRSLADVSVYGDAVMSAILANRGNPQAWQRTTARSRP